MLSLYTKMELYRHLTFFKFITHPASFKWVLKRKTCFKKYCYLVCIQVHSNIVFFYIAYVTLTSKSYFDIIQEQIRIIFCLKIRFLRGLVHIFYWGNYLHFVVSSPLILNMWKYSLVIVADWKYIQITCIMKYSYLLLETVNVNKIAKCWFICENVA